MKLSSLLDRMENSTIQALERQVDHLTKEKKRLEAEVERLTRHLRHDHTITCEYNEGGGRSP